MIGLYHALLVIAVAATALAVAVWSLAVVAF